MNDFRCMVCDKSHRDASKSGTFVLVEHSNNYQGWIWMTCRTKFCKQLAKDGLVMVKK